MKLFIANRQIERMHGLEYERRQWMSDGESTSYFIGV